MFFDNRIILIFIGIYLFINLISFLLMIIDKSLAVSDKRRISEKDLFFFSICFGALGVILGMFFSRHKIKKVKFLFGIPLALLQNITFFLALLYIYQTYLKEKNLF